MTEFSPNGAGGGDGLVSMGQVVRSALEASTTSTPAELREV